MALLLILILIFNLHTITGMDLHNNSYFNNDLDKMLTDINASLIYDNSNSSLSTTNFSEESITTIQNTTMHSGASSGNQSLNIFKSFVKVSKFIILIIGLITNCLNIRIWSVRKNQDKSSSVFITALSFSDLCK